jgi:HD-GYP domain-containing protein (c-di-GMP phosphodiesterase class II)
MPGITLSNPINTLDGQELFPAGSVINEESILSCLDSGMRPVFESCSLLGRGPFEVDILGFLTPEPYSHIFSSPESIQVVLDELEKVSLPVPVMESLLYFKNRDFYTYRHFLQVFALSTLVARDLAVDEQSFRHLAASGPTHDIGKICVPLPVLQKGSPLTREEKYLLNEHSIAGYVLMRYYTGRNEDLSSKVALEHHERRDGSGTPLGITLNDVMVEIVAVCDIYDALISPRPYRKNSYDNRTALEELCRMAEEGKIGWDAVKVIISYNRKSQPHYSEVFISDEKRGVPPSGNHYGVFSG